MGRDSRGDRYSRRHDGVTADRHGAAEGGGSNNSGVMESVRYGRYAATRRSRSPRGSRHGGSEIDRGADRHRRRRHSYSDERQRRRATATRDSGTRAHRRSRSSSSSESFKKGTESSSGRRRFEAVDVQELLNPTPPVVGGPTAPSLSSEIILALIQQQQQQKMGLSGDIFGMPPNCTPMAEAAISHSGQGIPGCWNQQQQQEEARMIEEQEEQKEQELSAQKQEKQDEALEESAPQPPISTKVLPSVADFVPVIPKSLLGLLGAPASSNNGNNVSGNGSTPEGDAEKKQEGALTTTTGALAVLQAPKLSPEAERRAREARRAHISCFPQGTTQQELLDYFKRIIPMVRHMKVQREINQIAEAMHADEDGQGNKEQRELPPNAIVDVDSVIDLAVNTAKSKPFAFLEVNLADLVTELVEESQQDPERFIFFASDGKAYPMTIRRPRDYQALPGVDRRKVVMLGFPPSLSTEKLRIVFEQFGTLVSFDVKAGMAYGEFEKESEAIECVRDLHGEMLGNNVLVLMPLYDWLKVVCTHADIDVALDPDDPVSGASLLAKDAQNEGLLVPVLAEELAKKDEPVDHMKELVELTVLLQDVVLHFAKTFPHLATLYGSTVPIFPTRVLVLLNLFDEEELVLDETYECLVSEIAGEVEKYGRVKLLLVPRRSPPPIPPKPPKGLLASRTRTVKRGGAARGGGQSHYRNYQTDNVDRSNRKGCGDDDGGDTSTTSTFPHASSNNIAGRINSYGIHEDEDGCNEEDEEAIYEKAKVEYLRARELYTENLMHPIHGGFGRVFVEYESVDEATLAQRSIAGRLFGGRTVVTSFMFEDILHPPSPEEEKKEADEKLRLYLECVGAAADGDDDDDDDDNNNTKEYVEKKGVDEVHVDVGKDGGGENFFSQ